MADKFVMIGALPEIVVLDAGDEIVWVAGVAVDERFAATDDAPDAIGLSATRR